MQTVQSLYANFCAIANPLSALLRQGSEWGRRALSRRCRKALTLAHCEPREGDGARGRLGAFSASLLFAGLVQFGYWVMHLNLPLKRKVPHPKRSKSGFKGAHHIRRHSTYAIGEAYFETRTFTALQILLWELEFRCFSGAELP